MYPAESPCATGRRVLVVEDHRDNRESLRTLLRLWGFCVETAADGRQGVAKSWNVGPMPSSIPGAPPIPTALLEHGRTPRP